MGKLKDKIKDYITIILIFFILSLYLIYIKPVGLYEIINNGSIRSVFITVIINDLQENEINKVPNYYSITLEKEDYGEYMKILNKYEYSKIPIYYFDEFRPTKFSDRIIDCTVNYNDENVLHQQVTVYSDNEVRFYNNKGVYRNYSVYGNEKKIFDELLNWLNDKYITY